MKYFVVGKPLPYYTGTDFFGKVPTFKYHTQQDILNSMKTIGTTLTLYKDINAATKATCSLLNYNTSTVPKTRGTITPLLTVEIDEPEEFKKDSTKMECTIPASMLNDANIIRAEFPGRVSSEALCNIEFKAAQDNNKSSCRIS